MKHARSDYDRIQDPAGLIPAEEPVFLLRGQDRFAAQTLRHYANSLQYAEGADPEMIRLTREQADRMDAWPKHKTPDLPKTE